MTDLGIFSEETGVQVGSAGRKRKFGGYAHFPGTGPDGKQCRDCAHMQEAGTRKRVCAEWARLMQEEGPPKSWRSIDSAASACKYFAQAEKRQ